MNQQDEKTYYSLREEIRYNQNLENVIIMFTYTSCIAMLAFAFSEKSEIVAVLAQLALIPFAYKVGKCRDTIAYLAAYLCEVLEPKGTTSSWERNNRTYKKDYKHLKKLLVIMSRIDLLILSFICAISSGWIFYNRLTKEFQDITDAIKNEWQYCIFLSILLIVGFIAIVHFTRKFSDIDDMKEEKINNWKALLDNKKLV